MDSLQVRSMASVPIVPNLFVDISTDDGAVTIMWHQLETLTDGELQHLRIGREQLRWVFDESERLKEEQGNRPGGRVPCAYKTLDGEWHVELVESCN
jgi:hypothetical protein